MENSFILILRRFNLAKSLSCNFRSITFPIKKQIFRRILYFIRLYSNQLTLMRKVCDVSTQNLGWANKIEEFVNELHTLRVHFLK